MTKTPETYDFIKDPEMRELLFGEGGIYDDSPPVLPMLKRWTGSPKFHLDTTKRPKGKTPPKAAISTR